MTPLYTPLRRLSRYARLNGQANPGFVLESGPRSQLQVELEVPIDYEKAKRYPDYPVRHPGMPGDPYAAAAQEHTSRN